MVTKVRGWAAQTKSGEGASQHDTGGGSNDNRRGLRWQWQRSASVCEESKKGTIKDYIISSKIQGSHKHDKKHI